MKLEPESKANSKLPMKKLIVILLLISSIVNAQSSKFKGIHPGLDSTAFANHIKSKFEYIFEIDSFQIDTIWKMRYDYLQNGYLQRYEEKDLKFFYESDFWQMGYNYIEFQYNEKGYLIDTKEMWGGPINVGSSSDSVQTTTKKIYDNNLLKKETVIYSIWFEGNESFTDTTITIYNTNGSISKIEQPQFSNKIFYIYDKNGLLIRMEHFNSTGLFKYVDYKYEYFE